jgi:hypothetical protein
MWLFLFFFFFLILGSSHSSLFYSETWYYISCQISASYPNIRVLLDNVSHFSELSIDLWIHNFLWLYPNVPIYCELDVVFRANTCFKVDYQCSDMAGSFNRENCLSCETKLVSMGIYKFLWELVIELGMNFHYCNSNIWKVEKGWLLKVSG